jgi:hypothetical protein
MQLTIDFTPEQLRGITAAREAHNANPPSESEAPFATNEEYLAWVMQRAADSYASQYPAS